MSSCDASQNPWIEWYGGKCPVPDLTIVEVEYRNGQIECPLPACEFDWGGPGDWGDWDWDIVAYRLAQPDSASLPDSDSKEGLDSASKEGPDSDGWIPWNAGLCPVHPDVLVEVRFRDGSAAKDEARYWNWEHDGGDDDIVAYRVVDECYAKPAPDEGPIPDDPIPEPLPLYVFDTRGKTNWLEYGGVALSNLIARVYLTRDLVARLAQELRERNPQTVELDANTVLGIVRNFLDSAQEVERELSEKELPPSGISYHMLWDRIERLISDLDRVKAPLPERSIDTLRELEKIADERYERILQLESEIEAHRERAQSLMRTGAKLREKLREKWQEARRELDGVRAQLQDAVLDRNELQHTVGELRAQAEHENQRRHNAEAMVDDLAQERNDLQKELAEQKRIAEELRSRMASERTIEQKWGCDASQPAPDSDIGADFVALRAEIRELYRPQENLALALGHVLQRLDSLHEKVKQRLARQGSQPDSDKTLDDCKDKFSNYQLNFRAYDTPCAYTLTDPKQARLYGYVLAVEAIQSGKHFGQFDDRTQNAIRYFITPENIRLALES